MIVNHIGIYGICIKDNRLLCIKKEKGPYRNRFDLPGGSQKDVVLEILDDELNDSSGIYWINLEKLDISNASPVILKLVQELSNDEAILEKVVYNNWKIL